MEVAGSSATLSDSTAPLFNIHRMGPDISEPTTQLSTLRSFWFWLLPFTDDSKRYLVV